MPDLARITQSFVLDFKKPVINRLKVVNGDTANTFEITLKDAGKPVQLNADLHKVVAVFKRADGQVYTQDASTDLTFTTAGVVTIDVRAASFRSGTNTIELQVYKRENSSATEYPLLATTYPQAFTARNETLVGEGENAPSQLPMLEQIIHDAAAAVTACAAAIVDASTATSAANDAATLANTKAGLADAAATNANTKAGLADEAATAANNAATDADHAAQEAYTRGADASAAASAANAAAAAATAAAELMQQTFYNVPLRNPSSWDDDPKRLYYINVTLSKLQTIMQNSRLVVVITDPNDNPITLYEFMRTDQYVGFHSPANVSGVYYTASLDYTASPITRTLTARQKMMNTPTQASVSNGVITFKDANSTSLFTVTLPVYNGGVS